MKDKDFRDLLSQVADWRIPETITGTKDGKAKKIRRRGRPSAEDLFLEQQEQEFLNTHGGINETFPPQLTKLKTAAVNCEDCGKHCPNGRKTDLKLYRNRQCSAWRERCQECGLTRDPHTGKFELKAAAASTKWSDFMRETKGTYKSKGNLAKERMQVQSSEIAHVEENEHETITFYREKN